MLLKKIISGGQTGADQAGLCAAKYIGLETGGWMPKGFLTQDGFRPQFAIWYDIKEHSSPKYPPRTALNAKESDGTIRIATNFESAGEKLTLKFIKQYNKPHFDIIPYQTTALEVKEWLVSNNIEILNIAGNSERTSPGIFRFAFKFLVEVFSMVK